MQAVTKWRSDDGTEFDDKDACQLHDHKAHTLKAITDVVQAVPGAPNVCKLIMHDEENVRTIRDELSAYLKRTCGKKRKRA